MDPSEEVGQSAAEQLDEIAAMLGEKSSVETVEGPSADVEPDPVLEAETTAEAETPEAAAVEPEAESVAEPEPTPEPVAEVVDATPPVEPAPAPAEPEADPRDAQIAALVAQLQAKGAPAQVAKPESPAEPEGFTQAQLGQIQQLLAAQQLGQKHVVQPGTAEPVPDTIPFIADADQFNKVFEGPESLNLMLNKVYDAARARVMNDVPNMVQNLTHHILAGREMASEFFNKNPQLVKFRPFVQNIATELEAKNPSWGVEKVLEESGKAAYEQLGIKLNGATPAAVPTSTPDPIPVAEAEPAPAFAPKGSGATPAKGASLSDLEREIGEMIDSGHKVHF